MRILPIMQSDHVRNIGIDILLTLVTCFLFNIYIQYRQILALNEMTHPERYSFLKWFCLTIITCGIYHFYHEYRKSLDICEVTGKDNSSDPIVHLLLAIFGLGIVVDALQQIEINKYFGNEAI